jgi:hypothetical protein
LESYNKALQRTGRGACSLVARFVVHDFWWFAASR